jgi:hypothetical protein
MAYICTYHHLQQQSSSTPCSTNTDEPVPVVAKQELLYTEMIERLMKAFKGHRCALDFDRGFVNSILKKGKEEMNNNDWRYDLFYNDNCGGSTINKVSCSIFLL